MTTTNQASQGAASTWTSTERDWPEDFKLENGNYMNICTTCKQGFMGYKRRFTCKVCASQGAPATPREAARFHVKSLTACTTELVGEVIAKGMQGVLEECIEMQITMNELKARAEAAEQALVAVRRGVEGLQGYDKARVLVSYADVLALLAPQGQSDTSGLPG